MLLFGNSGRHVTLKVHARSWLPLQRINILSDAGANCSIFGCGMSRKPKYEGIGIFKIPPSHEKKTTTTTTTTTTTKNKESWRKASLHVVTRDRVVDCRRKFPKTNRRRECVHLREAFYARRHRNS